MMRPQRVTRKRVIYEFVGRLAFPLFAPVYAKASKTCNQRVLEAIGIATSLYHHPFETLARIVPRIKDVPGDVAECGVWKGETLFGIAHLLRHHGIERSIFGFDSFEGLPAPTLKDSIAGVYQPQTRQGVFADTSVEYVRNRAKRLGFANIQLVKGFFEHTLKNFPDHRFALVHIDVDLYQSYRECLEFFYPRISPGGYIVFDEYDWTPTYPGAGPAINEHFADKPEQLQRFTDLGGMARVFIQRSVDADSGRSGS